MLSKKLKASKQANQPFHPRAPPPSSTCCYPRINHHRLLRLRLVSFRRHVVEFAKQAQDIQRTSCGFTSPSSSPRLFGTYFFCRPPSSYSLLHQSLQCGTCWCCCCWITLLFLSSSFLCSFCFWSKVLGIGVNGKGKKTRAWVWFETVAFFPPTKNFSPSFVCFQFLEHLFRLSEI